MTPNPMSIPIITNTDTDTTLTTDTDTTIPKEDIAKECPEPDPTPIDLGETALTVTTARPMNTGMGYRLMV